MLIKHPFTEQKLFSYPKEETKLKVGLFFPGPYEAGMSSLALHSLFFRTELNPYTKAFRFFFSENEYFSPDNGAINQLDVALITSSFEFDYLNLIKIARDLKAEKVPAIMGGMSTRINLDFFSFLFDVIYLGQLDERFDKLLAQLVEEGVSPQLENFKQLSFKSVLYKGKGNIDEHISNSKPNFIPHTQIITPNTSFGKSFLIEVSNGCRRRCSFCLLSEVNKPAEVHDQKAMLELLKQLPKGIVTKVGLVSAALTDYPDVSKFIKQINQLGFLVNTSSLRMEQLTEEHLDLLIANKQKTITLAPETSSKHLRKLIGKAYDISHLYQLAEKSSERGFRRIKLYYMVGLPGEELEDIEGIIEQIAQVRQAAIRGAQISKVNPEISISVNPFIPKPLTRMEKYSYDDIKRIKKKLMQIRKGIGKIGNIKMDWDSPRLGRLQYLLACHMDKMKDILLTAGEENWGILKLEKASREITYSL